MVLAALRKRVEPPVIDDDAAHDPHVHERKGISEPLPYDLLGPAVLGDLRGVR
jgi:hypothetical protein